MATPTNWLSRYFRRPKLVNVDGDEYTVRENWEFSGAVSIVDDEENDTTHISFLGPSLNGDLAIVEVDGPSFIVTVTGIGGVPVDGPGDVPVDEAYFGVNRKAKSFLFEKTSTDDSGETFTIYALSPNEAADISVTVMANTDVSAEVYLADLRRQLHRNGSSNVAACTGDINQEDIRIAHTDNDVQLTFSGVNAQLFIQGTGGEDQNWTIIVTVTSVQKGGT